VDHSASENRWWGALIAANETRRKQRQACSCKKGARSLGLWHSGVGESTEMAARCGKQCQRSNSAREVIARHAARLVPSQGYGYIAAPSKAWCSKYYLSCPPKQNRGDMWAGAHSRCVSKPAAALHGAALRVRHQRASWAPPSHAPTSAVTALEPWSILKRSPTAAAA
jgi:hypothetical protein